MVQSGRSATRRSAILVCAALLAVGSLGFGRDGPSKPRPPAKPAGQPEPAPSGNADFDNPLRFYDRRVQALYGASQVVNMTCPLGALGVLKADASLHMWQDFCHKLPPPAEPESPAPARLKKNDLDPTIEPGLLVGIEDGTPVRNAEQNYDESWAYGYLLTRAHTVPAEEFHKRTRKDITFAHMFEEPSKYRAQIVHVEGGLRRLRRFDAPRRLWKEGLRHVYEGWIYPNGFPENPLCVLVTNLPPGLGVTEKFSPPVEVAFDGYFFKKYLYKTAELEEKKKPVWRDTPLLIGPTLSVARVEEIPVDPKAELADLMPYIVGIVIGTILLIGGLSWWFRRGDRAVVGRVNAARANAFVEPSSDGETPPTEPQWTNEPEGEVDRLSE